MIPGQERGSNMADERNEKTLESFIHDPQSLYENPESIKDVDKQEIYSLEEALARLMVSGRMKNTDQTEEERVKEEEEAAFQADHVNQAEISTAAYELLVARKLMENPALPNRALPEALERVLKRDAELIQSGTKEKTPGAIIRLSKDGMDLIKSTLRGIAVLPQAFEGVRSAAAPVLEEPETIRERNPRLEMVERADDGLVLSYQIVREADESVMLHIRFLNKKPGTYRVNLLEDGRIMDSRNLAQNSDALSFQRIGTGRYDINIDGAQKHEFGFYIEAD